MSIAVGKATYIKSGVNAQDVELLFDFDIIMHIHLAQIYLTTSA